MAEENVQTQEQPEQTQVVARTAVEPPAGKHWWWGTGRRKKSVARVRIRPGSGKLIINKRELEDYFPDIDDRETVLQSLRAVSMLKDWDVYANANGGGLTGQAGSVSLGLARALMAALPEAEHALRDKGLLTRDARMKERKKYGQRGARRRFQFSKR